jgi:DNA-binding transcriptional LysR family regulator
MRGLNLDHLRAFTLVAELGSFSAAAARLGVTQPAISQQLRELERRLGVRLIERVGRRATATAAGSELLAHAQDIASAVAAATEAVARHASGAIGWVRLGTGATACIYLLPPILGELRRRLPGLEIVVSTGNTTEILRSLEVNLLDLALVTCRRPGGMFEVTPLFEDELLAIDAAAESRLPGAVTPASLARLPLVLYERGGHTRRLIDDWFLAAGIDPRPVMELGSVEAIKNLVGAGLGSAILPAMALGADQAPIVWRPLAPPLQRQLGLVLRRDKPLSRGLREMIRALEGLARARSAQPNWLR